jgi:rhodanese-related sulfurtransferase
MKGSVKYGIVLMLSMLGIVTATFTGSVFLALSAEFQYISPKELKKLIETKADILVVDVQPKIAYEIGHIKGAINFPWASEIKGPVNLPKDKLLVMYCDCAHEEDSTDVAKQLTEEWGYKSSNIKLLKGGWSGWLKLGYPTEKGKSQRK